MRRLIIAIALGASGCVNGAIPTSPVAVANTTVLDEKAGTGFELAYKAFRVAAETAVDAGLVKGPKAAQLATIDNHLYNLIIAERSAYKTANAASYYAAINIGEQTIADGLAVLKGK